MKTNNYFKSLLMNQIRDWQKSQDHLIKLPISDGNYVIYERVKDDCRITGNILVRVMDGIITECVEFKELTFEK